MIDYRQIDTAKFQERVYFPIDLYTISFVCILLLFNVRYLRNEQNNFKNDVNSDIFDTFIV